MFFQIILFNFTALMLDWPSAVLAQKDAYVLCERILSNNPKKMHAMLKLSMLTKLR